MRNKESGGIRQHPPKRGPMQRAWRKALAYAMSLVLMLGNVLGMAAPVAAYAADGGTIEFANGGTATQHADGSITGTCRLVDALISQDHGYSARAVMPDGNTYDVGCYEVLIGKPDHDMYVGPCDGTYAFTATPKDNGYFVLIHSQNAARPAPGAHVSGAVPGYPYQRTYVVPPWNPEIKVSVSFTKVSADATVTNGNSEYAYAGATYDIYDASNNQKVATITTDNNGHASYKLAPNKSYYAVETKAPQGFKVNPNRIPFATGNTGSAEQLADDPGWVKVSIVKKDSATLGTAQPGATLAGAEFKVVSLSTPGWEASGETDADGKLVITKVPFGDIVITETKAPKGYKLDPTPHHYTISHGGGVVTDPIELTPEDDFKENVVAFDLTVAKTKGGENGDWESDDGQAVPAAGVKFEIVSNTTDKVVGTLTTNENGFASTKDAATVNPEAVSEGATYDPAKPWMGEGKRTEAHKGALPYDAAGYTVREVDETVPEGFDHVDDWRLSPEQMADGAELQFSVIDKTLNSKIQIVKTDSASGNTVPLAGFAFNILDSEGRKVSMTEAGVDTFTTDESGWVTLPDRLPSGDYKVHEAAAQPPYVLNGEDVPFTVSDDFQNAEPVTVVKVADAQAYGVARIAKLCADDGCAWCAANGRTGLTGAEFDVMAMEDVVSPDGTVQAVNGQVVDHVAVEDGKAETKLLPLGDGAARYAFVETKAPAGHKLDETSIEFELTWEDDETEIVYADVTAKNAPTETIVEKTVAGTEEPLEGAVFDLWPDFLEAPADSGADDAGAVELTLPALPGKDGAGNAKVTLVQQFAYAEIAFGMPEGHTVALKDGKGAAVPIRDGKAAVAPGSYAVCISDENGSDVELGDKASLDVEAGKAYKVEYDKGVLGWGAGLSVKASDMTPASYNERDFAAKGDILSLKQAVAGTYELTVTSDGEEASTELSVVEGRTSFAIAEGGTVRTASHGLLPFMQGALDAAYEELGIGLVTDEDGLIDVKHLPARGEDMAALMKSALAHAGADKAAIEAAFENVDAAGQIAWRLQETSAPEGFLVDPAVHEFTVHDDGLTEGKDAHEIPIEDDYTKVEISKRDVTNEAEIEGAKLSIADSDGDVVAEWVSDGEPHRIDALKPGTYTLTEEMTPNNYDKAQSVEFVVEETGEIQRVVMYDKPVRISGEIDKRQEIADPVAKDTVENGDLQNKADVTVSDKGLFDYSIDYRSTSNTWADEFTVEDSLDAVEAGTAELVGITTAQGFEDYDGLMNVWFKTDQTPADYLDESGANATLSDGHDNPWLADGSNAVALGDDGRALDYAGWRLWKADVSTTSAEELKVEDLELAEGEKVTAVRFEYGRVEEGFATRLSDWDRENIKSGHDDLDDVKADHGETFEGAEGAKTPYAPAIVHMKVTDDYKEGARLDNSAKVDLFRNGGGSDLEDHDDDFVTQVPKTVKHEVPPRDLDQTGGSQMAIAAGCAAVAAAALAAYTARRKKAAPTEPDPDGGGSGKPETADPAAESGKPGPSDSGPSDAEPADEGDSPIG